MSREVLYNAVIKDIQEEEGVEEVSFLYVMQYFADVLDGKRNYGVNVQNALNNSV